MVGPTCQVTCARVGLTWVMWSNRGLTCGKLGAEVASCCAAMCELRFNSLLMWLCVAVPCGIGWVRWPCMAVPCGIDWDEVDHWLTATWHCDGAHLSGDLCLGGAHLLTWTNRRVPRGTQLLRWLNQGLPRGTVIAAEFLNLCPSLSPSCTQSYLDQISALDLPI
jgi:hypothetical protein